MSDDHIRTPWEYGPSPGSLPGLTTIQSARHHGLVAYVSTEATARRIIACCTAFEGVPLEVIEAFNKNPQMHEENIVADLMSRRGRTH